MDFFDLPKELNKEYLKNDKSQDFANIDDEYMEDIDLRFNFKKGTSYAEEYILKQNQEIENQYTEMASSSELSPLEQVSMEEKSNTNETQKEHLTEIYKEYYKNEPRGSKPLTINKYKNQILSMIEANEVTLIAGPTGCGKTTRVPLFILDSCAEKNLYCNILVTQPRRIAATSIPKRVCDERDWELGTICGFKVGLKDCTSEDTRLTYVTIGLFLQIIVNLKHLNNYTHIILDEVHERDENMDFSLLVVKKLLNSNSRNVKIILMSATANMSKFANYFEKRILGKPQPAPVINIERGSNYAVQTHYLEELSPLGELPEIKFENPCISELGMSTCIKLIKQFEILDKDADQKSSVLVFLPGLYEIEELFQKLRDPKIYKSGRVEYKWFLIPLHSEITKEEQALAFQPPPTGYRKIILATNIAESSITVPDIMFVIDFCLTKVLITDTTSNFTSLQTRWASKANCIQRAGRAGRVMEGRVYRMVYKDFYEELDDHSIPDLLRCPLEKVVLRSKLLDMGSPKALLALALDPPDLSDIERTILILKEVGGLLLTSRGVSSPYDGDLTILGRLMAVMPVDIHITRLIVLGHLFSCLEQCIIMGAAMSLKSSFSNFFQARLKSYSSKLEWADGSFSDSIAFLNLYNAWRTNHNNGFFKRSAGGGEVGWAKRNFVQLRTLREVQFLIEELVKRLKMHHIEKTAGLGKVQWSDTEIGFILKFVLAGAFYPNYFTRSERGGQVSEEIAIKTLGGRDLFSTVYLKNYPLDQPPELYSHSIKERFAECTGDIKISYENSSKVYVEFEKQGNENENHGKISKNVYKAVKMRHTMKYVEINAMAPDQAMKMAEKLGLRRKMNFFLGDSSTETKEKLFQSTVPDNEIDFIRLKITHIENPNHFWAMYKDETSDQYEKKIFYMLNDSDADLEVYSEMPKVGEMCVAPYEEDDWLYRANIRSLEKKNNEWMAKVFFIDYGNVSLVPVTRLLKYGPKLLPIIGKIPAQCFKCTLTKIKPSLFKNSWGEWCEAAKKEFLKLTRSGDLMGFIYSVVEDVVSLVLYCVIDFGSSSRQININQHLMKQGYAEEREESNLSRANHKMRKQMELNSKQEETYNTFQMRENSLETTFTPPDIQDCNIKLKLGGPFSPLEMKIFSCTRGGSFKQVTINPASVNCVLLDSDPQDPHERMIIAAEVRQNQAGSNLILNNTTIMPNIHGLAALIPFIFAPTLELRVNEKRTRYTGFICGLGADDKKRSLFPEHDMEFVFDCEFTYEDFLIINRLRFFMSLLLLSDGEDIEAMHSHSDILIIQRKIKNLIMKLLNKERPSKELEFAKKEYRWGLVNPDLYVNDKTVMKCSRFSIFPLHPGVSINSESGVSIPDDKKDFFPHVEELQGVAEDETSKGVITEFQLHCAKLGDDESVKSHPKTEEHKAEEELGKSED